jgi:osmotically-inducible protein OsmY
MSRKDNPPRTGDAGSKLNDQKIKEIVSDVLLHSHEVDASEIEIDVQDGVVTMNGYISSKGMLKVAEDLVGSIPCVEDVFTQLKIHDTSNFQLNEKALNEARNTDQS